MTTKNCYSLPLIGKTLDRLLSARIYTKIDLQDAYNLICIREGNKWKTAFCTQYGHFEYRVMPFGQTNAPATFQGDINYTLHKYFDVICIVYLDNIIIYLDTSEEHTGHVCTIFALLQKAGLYAKLSKCQFSMKHINFVGYDVTPNRVAIEEDCVRTVLQ